MARLINADSVEYALSAICDRESGVPLVLAEWLANVVRNAPTVDAVEVVHGRWINKTQVIHGQVDYMFVCSACGNIYWDSITDSFDYCPNCGAKMDGERKDND